MRINEKITVDILRFNDQGHGVAQVEDKIVFIPYAMSGEKCVVEIKTIKKNFCNATLVEVINESPDRVVADCPYYGTCGGCTIMHMNYAKQLQFKSDKVKRALSKFGDIKLEDITINASEQYNYRNKATLKVNGLNLGYYQSGTHYIAKIENCLLVDEMINQLIKVMGLFIGVYDKHNIQEVIIKRGIENQLMLVIKGEFELVSELIDFLKEQKLELTSIYINDDLVHGVKTITKELKGYKFSLSNNSFFQVNDKMADKLLDKICESVPKDSKVLDLYAGTGVMAALISKTSKFVIGIEIVEAAYLDGLENLKQNGFDNVQLINADVAKTLETYQDYDAVIVDPPRTGLDKEVVEQLLEISPEVIVYASCEPITLARDLKLLASSYEIKSIECFDMFPNTFHLETLVILRKLT